MHFVLLIKSSSTIFVYLAYATKPPVNELPAIYSPQFRRAVIRNSSDDTKPSPIHKGGFLPAIAIALAVAIIYAGLIYGHRKWRQRVERYRAKVWNKVNFIRAYKKKRKEENEVEGQSYEIPRLTLPEPVHVQDLERGLLEYDDGIDITDLAEYTPVPLHTHQRMTTKMPSWWQWSSTTIDQVDGDISNQRPIAVGASQERHTSYGHAQPWAIPSLHMSSSDSPSVDDDTGTNDFETVNPWGLLNTAG